MENVSVITSSVKKKHFIQAHGQKYIYTYIYHWNILIHELLVLA